MNLRNTIFSLGLSLAAVFTATHAGAASFVSGNYNGRTFSVSIADDNSYAQLSWLDGAQGFSAYLNPNPSPRPRCICNVFEAGIQRITVEYDFANRPILATYSGSARQEANSSIRGTYQGYTFLVTLSADKEAATLTWDDGTQGFTAVRNPYPNPTPRCICNVYETRERRITVELFNGQPIWAQYSRR